MNPPIPLEHKIHVWQAQLDIAPVFFEELKQCLSAQELERGSRFLQPIHKMRFFNAHIILRQIIASYLKRPPAEVKLLYSSRGKPYILEEAFPEFQFNMSHSQDRAFYAVHLGGEIGIDVEYIKSGLDYLGIAQRFFSPLEYKRLAELPEEQHQEAFYRCWTQKEAYVKAIGTGLSHSLESFEIDFLKPEGVNSLISTEYASSKDWKVSSIYNKEGYVAALAVEGGFEQITFNNWRVNC